MASMLVSLGLMKPPPDPAEQMKEWQKDIKKQIRRIERDISALDREEKKHVAECRKVASRDRKAMMITAKSIVQSRKAKEKMYLAKANMSTMQNQIATQASMLKVAGAIGKSTEVMKSLNGIMKIGAMTEDMRALAKEMEKAGLIGELMEEAMDGLDDGVEEEASAEVTKLLMEVVPDMPDAPWAAVNPKANGAAAAAVTPSAAAEEVDDAEMAALAARADAL